MLILALCPVKILSAACISYSATVFLYDTVRVAVLLCQVGLLYRHYYRNRLGDLQLQGRDIEIMEEN